MHHDSNEAFESMITMEEYLEKRQQMRKNSPREGGREFWITAAQSAVMELQMFYV